MFIPLLRSVLSQFLGSFIVGQFLVPFITLKMKVVV
jgi:hypothetical protein